MLRSEPVLVPGIILSDHVIREQGTNKATCVGIFNMFNIPQFPFRVPRFFATVGITNLQGEIRELDATCRLEVSGTGHVLASSSAHLAIPPEAPPISRNIVIDLTFPFHNVTLPTAGTYSVVVLVNNEEIGRRTLEVFAITATGQQEEPRQ
jgi:hypothetical protein